MSTIKINGQTLSVASLNAAAPELYLVVISAILAAGAAGANADVDHFLRPLWEAARAAIKSAETSSASRTRCDCERPEPVGGVALISNECPVHNR